METKPGRMLFKAGTWNNHPARTKTPTKRAVPPQAVETHRVHWPVVSFAGEFMGDQSRCISGAPLRPEGVLGETLGANPAATASRRNNFCSTQSVSSEGLFSNGVKPRLALSILRSSDQGMVVLHTTGQKRDNAKKQ
jgi:hypothetical protein